MNPRLFGAVFLLTFMVTLYFLGSSITGYISQSMHCEDGFCYRMCNSDSDCTTNKGCCDNGGYGICKSECDSTYYMNPMPDLDVEVEISPHSESPAPQVGNQIMLFLILLGAILIVSIVYYVNHHKRS